MNARTVTTILRKELLDTLRDKRTLIMMIGLPIILYPAMLIFGMQIAIVQQNKLEETRSRVAIEGVATAQLRDWLNNIEMVDVVESAAPEEALLAGNIESVVRVRGELDPVLEQGGSVPVEILFDSTELESRDAADRLEDGLEKVTKDLRDARLHKAGLAVAYIEPLKVKQEDLAPAQKTSGMVLGLLVPLLMVLMIALGAFYPAIDLTAGEKERGTFETLLSTPATKLEIVTGKFLTVFTLAMATGILNLASMALTFLFMLSQFSAAVKDATFVEGFQLPLEAFFIILLVMIPLGFLLSSMMMSVAVMARSFKEAQNYITPFFLIVLLPAFMAGIPGTELTPFSEFVPIYNVVLLFRELMTDKATVDEAVSVFVSTAAYASLALWFSAWLFQREEVVLSEERGIPLTVRRSEFRPRPTLTPGGALGWYSVMLIALFYLGSLVQQWKLIPGLLITQFVILLGGTLAVLWFLKVDWRTALHLRRLSARGFLGALLLGAGAVLLLIQFSAYHNKFLPMPKMLEEEFMKLFQTENIPGGIFTLLFAVGLAPGLCEELFMRGAVLSGVRQRLGTWGSVLVIGLLFGVLHISIYRILPTALLGAALTYMVLRTGSIWSSVAVHALNNCFGVLVATGHAPVFVETALNIQEAEKSGLPWLTLVAAVVLVLVGVGILEWQWNRDRGERR
ncbi:MAG: CPBP family intramembrane metalloprotease [Candidatus Hydrogenedentes bacterium]|nr:CPBP family intramembrane metalloprotease [Candidatus Hydrogenedentota bacterium]